MMNVDHLKKQIFNIESESHFEQLALDIFYFQAEHCNVYKSYLQHLHRNPLQIKSIDKIPFLPIEFFKSQFIYSGNSPAQITFTSSGTTGENRSKHAVADLQMYQLSFLNAFRLFYGDIQDYNILALLPSYLERDGSSLIYMIQKLINESKNQESGFFLYDFETLKSVLEKSEEKFQKTLLIGVTYALVDFAEKYSMNLNHTYVMETGGMKGRRKEMIRTDLHNFLCKRLGTKSIHSEYGMTELLSQAYSLGNGEFACPLWMKVLIRDAYNPFELMPYLKSGGINVIDLANIHSCSFIETNDLGIIHPNGNFEVTGRFDHSDIRGCNLLVN